MDDFVYKRVTQENDPDLVQVGMLFSEMYSEMKEQGLLLELADDGMDKWMTGMKSALGRFGVLAVAVREGQLVGFAHGALKLLPDYLGGHKAGIITHIYVSAPYRSRKVGRKLVEILEDWFAEKQVHSIELQVISKNPARRFWEKTGYGLELYQYRKFPGEKS